MKFYCGSAGGARTYLESDRSRTDDYYLAEGSGLATRTVATPTPADDMGAEGGRGVPAGQRVGTLDGDAYEQWVAGYDVETGDAKGRLRHDEHGLRFVEVVVNGPKTWSLAAALHPEIAKAYEAAQDRAAGEIIDWLAGHSTTRVGPRGRQVQVPVEQLEAAVVRHYTSRAGDPHRHLHLQVNARVYAAGGWRGLHSAGVVKSIEAINGIGHAAVACDPEFRQALAAHGYTLDAKTGEVAELAPYAGAFSARAAQITRTIDRYEAAWRCEHPDAEPGRALRRAWDRRAWAQTRPDKVVPANGAALEQRWVQELADQGFTPPAAADPAAGATAVGSLGLGTPIGRINRDAVADLVLVRLGGRRSSWNAADIRGEVERIIAGLDVIAAPLVRRELAEDLTTRAVQRCVPLLARDDVPADVRALTSHKVLAVEADLIDRLIARAEQPGSPERVGPIAARRQLDQAQRQVVAALAGTASLIVVEGAAGAGKTTTLAAARELLEMNQQRLVVVTPTLKAARVAAEQVGTDAFSAAWLVHRHGYRWDTDGQWTRVPTQLNWGGDASGYASGYGSGSAAGDARAQLLPGDLLLVDEAGMLDQDTAHALLTIADQTGARIAFVGDRHQLPAVGRGGVLDHAARWAHPDTCVALETVHRFTDPGYADLTLLMRTGQQAGAVFDALLERNLVVLHPTDVQRLAAIADLAVGSSGAGRRVIADTREQVASLNAAIRDRRLATGDTVAGVAVTTAAGERIGLGDTVTTRRNDRDLGVANRDTWTVTGTDDRGGLLVHGRGGDRVLPAAYVQQHLELAYATTVHGAQGETVDRAHLLVGEATGAAAAYVGMTRGRESNTAHLVAAGVDEARAQWIDVFGRDRADLGPSHAARSAAEDLERYGPFARLRSQVPSPRDPEPRPLPPSLPSTAPSRGYGPSW